MGEEKRKRRKRAYRPTPEQIRAACWRIQETWTPAEERKRRVPHLDADPDPEMGLLPVDIVLNDGKTFLRGKGPPRVL